MRQLLTILLFAFFLQNVSAQESDTLADTSATNLNVKVVCLLVNDYDKPMGNRSYLQRPVRYIIYLKDR